MYQFVLSAVVLFPGSNPMCDLYRLYVSARRGLSVLDATLYCTTFPCHMSARHIIASGIKQVVYIEPYPKSLAKELYRKSIQVDFDVEADSDAVVFRPFVGISPNRYLDFFSMLRQL
jgi:tRNA(Arg) A34 adenosine deaminase TadA